MKAEYTKENTSPFTVAEMLGLFRNHEIVTFTIQGVGETCAETVLFQDAIERLATECQSPETQRLIEIGGATERVFETWPALLGASSKIEGLGPVCFYNVDELLEWHREQEVQHESD